MKLGVGSKRAIEVGWVGERKFPYIAVRPVGVGSVTVRAD